MPYKYFPHTQQDIDDMLAQCNVNSIDCLFSDIPNAIRFRKKFHIPEEKSEIEIRQFFNDLGKENRQLTCFSGAGVYDKYTPAVIPSLVNRSEFLTSYTPYQAEVSQGTLHYIFEFQTMMAELTGLPVSNASMYDGATATAEAMLMAAAVNRKANTVLVSETIDPKIMAVLQTYAHFCHVDLKTIPSNDGATDIDNLRAMTTENSVAGVIVQQPNYWGIIENYTGFADICHETGALFMMNANPSDLALLKSPGEWNADVAVGEGQSLGIPMSWGGPYLGYMCCTEKLMRKMPGRIVGQTIDEDGKRCFVLTLQAREQHIRRQKATSNICSNQSLMALWVTIYLSIMGKEGLKQAAQLSCDGAHYLYDQLLHTGRFKPFFNKPFFNEFVVSFDGDVEALQNHWIQEGFFGGIQTSKHNLMFAVTEQRTKEQIDKLVSTII